MQEISLIFPMAGQGARFGYRFKPFLEVREMSFIEAAFLPFRPWLSRIAQVYFVFTREQDTTHQVSARLDEMFADVPFEAVILDRATEGPAVTLGRCLESENISGPIMACDCDHALTVDGLMRAAENPDIECALPTWDLDGESLASWSVAAIGGDGRIAAVSEKALPAHGGCCRGIIGCYYFADAARVRRLIAETHAIHLSDVVARYLEEHRDVRSVPVREAYFFGDPARLARVASLGL